MWEFLHSHGTVPQEEKNEYRVVVLPVGRKEHAGMVICSLGNAVTGVTFVQLFN